MFFKEERQKEIIQLLKEQQRRVLEAETQLDRLKAGEDLRAAQV